MPKIKLTATLPCGTVATRTTARTYTHVVAGIPCYDKAMASATHAELDPQDGGRWLVAQQRAAGTYQWESWWGEVGRAREEAECKALIAEHPTKDGYKAAMRAARIAKVEADKAAGKFDRWEALSWAGRPDLAQKAAAGVWMGRLREVRVVPVNS